MQLNIRHIHQLMLGLIWKQFKLNKTTFYIYNILVTEKSSSYTEVI